MTRRAILGPLPTVGLALALPILGLLGWWAGTRGAGYRLIPSPSEVAAALGGFTDARNPSELKAAFRNIALEISTLRITQ